MAHSSLRPVTRMGPEIQACYTRYLFLVTHKAFWAIKESSNWVSGKNFVEKKRLSTWLKSRHQIRGERLVGGWWLWLWLWCQMEPIYDEGSIFTIWPRGSTSLSLLSCLLLLSLFPRGTHSTKKLFSELSHIWMLEWSMVPGTATWTIKCTQWREEKTQSNIKSLFTLVEWRRDR